MPRSSVLAMLFLLAPLGTLAGQRMDDAAAGVRPQAAVGVARVPSISLAQSTGVPVQDTAPARRRVAPYLLVGAIVGALTGALLESGYHDGCDSGPGVQCTRDYEGIGLVIGAGLGAVAGLLVYALTEPPVQPPPAPAPS